MPRHIAFLRAINVGGHTVKMEPLRAHFAELGLRNVSTFIASGNVIFDSPGKPAALEKKIEQHLHKVLGYEVDTFIRSLPELREIDADVERLPPAARLYVGFLRQLPSAAQQAQVTGLSNDIDIFTFGKRELYWCCRQGMWEATVTGPKLAKALGGSTTTRNITSLRKLMATLEK